MLINKSINFNFEGIFTFVIESFHNLHDFILDDISFLVGKDEYSFVLMIIITLDLILRLYNQWIIIHKSLCSRSSNDHLLQLKNVCLIDNTTHITNGSNQQVLLQLAVFTGTALFVCVLEEVVATD